MIEYRLTTTDNPYDPFTQYDEWFNFDDVMGYGTGSYLARLALTSMYLDPKTNVEAVNEAIDEIIAFDLIGPLTDEKVHYKKVGREF